VLVFVLSLGLEVIVFLRFYLKIGIVYLFLWFVYIFGRVYVFGRVFTFSGVLQVQRDSFGRGGGLLMGRHGPSLNLHHSVGVALFVFDPLDDSSWLERNKGACLGCGKLSQYGSGDASVGVGSCMLHWVRCIF
jgi:hypothetical protein